MPGGVLSSRLEYYELREPQIEMAERVTETLERGTTLLVEAATGTGKTWAYLIPAILSGKKVVISTGTKTLQDQLYLKDLPFLSKAFPGKFTFSMMKGKSNYLCLHRFGQFSQQPSFQNFEAESHFQDLQRWSTETRSGDRAEMIGLPEGNLLWQEVSVKGEACLGSQCPTYDSCYITRIKQEAAAADIVVVNHHLFFADLALKGISYGEVLPRYDAVIFDEAHLLEEVATQYFGVSISSYRIEDFVGDAQREFRFLQMGAAGAPPAAHEQNRHDSGRQCGLILFHSNRFFQFFRGGEDRYRLTRDHFEPAVLAAGSELSQSLGLLRDHILSLRLKSDGVSHLLERIEGLRADLQLFLAIEEGEGAYVYWGERRGQGVFLYASPLDVSEILRDRLFQREIPMILTSATLMSQNGFEYLRGRLGIDAAEERVLASPFDYVKQTLLYLPGRLPSPTDRGFASAISDEIVQILEASRGRAFLLFTSWRNLEEVYRNISGRVPYLLLKQGDRPKHALIETFRREVSSVLLGTTSFWQGVDIQGEALSCVVIDKLPFASPTDPLFAARIESLIQQGKDPFMTLQVPSAILSLRQGIGRLIRNREDRGVIAILDVRVTTKEYGKYFLSSLPASKRTDTFQDVRAFFASEDQP